ncbi:hypothetical protein [Pandoraea oxalativorans]|uniref:hypothetical protein n=1 Tax=Pandoraea oxalativorans TaxID=573737 RepID=UPI0012F4DEDB|nr:hypothetical protein [Pandoraea oxalativorans]
MVSLTLAIVSHAVANAINRKHYVTVSGGSVRMYELDSVHRWAEEYQPVNRISMIALKILKNGTSRKSRYFFVFLFQEKIKKISKIDFRNASVINCIFGSVLCGVYLWRMLIAFGGGCNYKLIAYLNLQDIKFDGF